MMWILVFGLLVVAVILILVGFKDNGRREPFSASDDTVEMPMDLNILRKAISIFDNIISFLNYVVKEYEIDVCSPFLDIDLLKLRVPLLLQAQIAKNGSFSFTDASSTTWKTKPTEKDTTWEQISTKLKDDIQTYIEYQFDRMWTIPKKEHGFAECFEDSKPRTVSHEQQELTTELERRVIIVEDLMKGEEMSQIRTNITKALSAYTFLNQLSVPNIVTMDTVFSKGACPDGMYTFDSQRACCPVKPTNSLTKCPVQKLDKSVTCSIKSGHPTLPTCRPSPSQGPCLPDYFLFAESKGGRCCPVPPADFDTTRGEYTTCPKVAKEGRTLCSLAGNEENIRLCYPPAATPVKNTQGSEGFQTVGRSLLNRANRVLDNVQNLIMKIIELETTKEKWDKYVQNTGGYIWDVNRYAFEFPASSPTTSLLSSKKTFTRPLSPTSSPKISRLSPSP